MDNYLKKHLSSSKLEQGLEQLKRGIPVQYIIGDVNFLGLTIKVNSNVLIPRFETEELVYKTINYLKNFKKPLKILDLGTGSGCIAIALAKKLNTNVHAVDISKKALKVAKENSHLNEVCIKFYLGNMFEPLNEKYDCIISNPPYLRKDEKLEKIVKKNEPAIALFAKNNGLEFYELILKDAFKYLNKEFLIALEIGFEQGKHVKSIAKKYFPDAFIRVEKDMQKRDRFVFIFNKKLKSIV